MILGTEVNEFVTNRQQSKIHYLAQENKYLQEYICDLENAIKLNKQAMSIAMDGFSRKTNQDSTMSICSPYQNQQVEQLVKHLNEENSKLMDALTKQQKISAQIQTKLLLSEQIGEEQQNYYKDLIADLEYKLIELKRNIHDKEYAIQELERMKPIQEKEGQLIKIVEIVTPSEQNLKLHEELENVRQVLNKITVEAQQISETSNNLKEVNYNLKREIFKMRIVLRSQTNYQVMKDFVFNEYIDKSDQNLELQREIQNHRGKLEQLHQEMYGISSLGYGFSPEPQQLKYLSKNERMIYQEKLHKMEMMVKGFKELFEKEKNNFQNCVRMYNEMQKKYEQILDNNELLIKSNQLKDSRLDKLAAELQFYKKQNGQFMEQLRTRKGYNNSQVSLNQEQDIAVGIFSPRFVQPEQKLNTQQSYFSNQKKQSLDRIQVPTLEDEEFAKQSQPTEQKSTFKKPKLDIQIDDPYDEPEVVRQQQQCMTTRGPQNIQKPQLPNYQYYDMTKEECINFLISMSLDFFQNFDVNNVKKVQLMKQMAEQNSNKPAQPRKLKRSYSNPFVYFSSQMDDQINFSRPPKNSVIAITKNEIESLLAEIQEKKKQQEFLLRGNDPFQIDISQIDIQHKPSNQNRMNKQIPDGDISFISNIEQQE